MRGRLFYLALALGCFLLCFADRLGGVSLGAALFVVIASVGAMALLAMIGDG